MNFKPHLRHLRYLLIHKRYVLVECFKRGLFWRGIIHDTSKFLPSEWFAYTRFFFNGRKNKEEFRVAYALHCRRNKHHWEAWVSEDGIASPMQEPYLTEMICDWMGAGKAHGQTSPKDDPLREVRNFWIAKGSLMNIHEETQKEIDRRLLP